MDRMSAIQNFLLLDCQQVAKKVREAGFRHIVVMIGIPVVRRKKGNHAIQLPSGFQDPRNFPSTLEGVSDMLEDGQEKTASKEPSLKGSCSPPQRHPS